MPVRFCGLVPKVLMFVGLDIACNLSSLSLYRPGMTLSCFSAANGRCCMALFFLRVGPGRGFPS